MSVDEMQAGPELDQLVAERVMGWKRHVWAERAVLVNTVYCTECGATENKGAEKRASMFCHHPDSDIPNYSVDIVAAWVVVEELNSCGHPISIRLDWHGKIVSGDGYARIYLDNLSGEYTQGGTAPLAICRAALKAILGIDRT